MAANASSASGIPPRASQAQKSYLNSNQYNSNGSESRKDGQLKIEILDDKRCNLEDDESFEEHKGGALTAPNGRNLMTPIGLTSRKSSINVTPKSRVIEPGKIFNARHMTPVSAGGMRGRKGGFYPQKHVGNLTNDSKQCRGNMITATEVC